MVKFNEKQWQAEDDARTMARYQEIVADKARMGRAVREAKKQANDLLSRANAMGKAASASTSSRSVSRGTRKK